MGDNSEGPEMVPRPPDFMVKLVDDMSSFLSSYGWYILIVGVLVLLFWPKIQDVLDHWYMRRQEMIYAAKYHKDPDWVRSRIEGLEAARQKMQEELDRKSAEYAARMAEREEKKRLERLEKLDGFSGHILGRDPSSSDKHKSEYTPLSGSSGGSTYKPQKRSCCPGGGGCG